MPVCAGMGPRQNNRPLLAQWRKWRTPVKTMAIPASSAALMESWSRTLPPGWMMAAMP